MMRRVNHLVTLSACHLVIFAAAARGAEVAGTQPVSDPGAVKELEGHLASLKGIRTLEVGFVCEKRLAMLESPLVSSGRLWIRNAAAGGAGVATGGGVRFSTERPYVSELILAEGKVLARSQHETTWTTTNQSARPGLTAVMLQLGGWSTGQGGGLTEMYAVTRPPQAEGNVPGRPDLAGGKAGAATQGGGVGATVRNEETIGGTGTYVETIGGTPMPQLFVLTPVNKDLAGAVKRVMVGMVGNIGGTAMPRGGEKGMSRLAFMEIVTAQEDVTRYWFFDGKVNGELPADVFKPVAGPSLGAASLPGGAGPAGGKP